MKTLFIGNRNMMQDMEMLDYFIDEEFVQVMNKYELMESQIVYFSAGEAKIKEILIKKFPSYSV